MGVIIKRKDSKEVKYAFLKDEVVTVGRDDAGNITGDVIHLPNYPHGPKKVGNTTFLGGTFICDKDYVANCDIIEDVQNVPADIKEKKYKYNKATKEFTLA